MYRAASSPNLSVFLRSATTDKSFLIFNILDESLEQGQVLSEGGGALLAGRLLTTLVRDVCP